MLTEIQLWSFLDGPAAPGIASTPRTPRVALDRAALADLIARLDGDSRDYLVKIFLHPVDEPIPRGSVDVAAAAALEPARSGRIRGVASAQQ